MNAQPKQKPQAEPQKSGSKRETEAFVATLRHLDRDGVLAEANAAVEAAVMAAKTTGGRAEVTVKLTIQRRGNNQMIVAGDVTKKLPRQKTTARCWSPTPTSRNSRKS